MPTFLARLLRAGRSEPRRRAVRRSLGGVMLTTFSLAWLPTPAAAQYAFGQAPADVEAIEVRELANAVRITLRANGVILLDPDPFFQATWRAKGGDWEPIPTRRVPIRLLNCRSRIGAFYNVGRYPVSHVQVAVPPDAPQGIGMDVTFVLYRPATVASMLLWEQEDPEQGWPVEGLGYDIRISPEKQSIIFTVMSDRFPPKPVERFKPGPRHAEQLTISSRNGALSVTARYVPLRTLLGAVTANTGERVLLEDGVERTVSLHVDGVRVADFLRALTSAYGLSLSRTNGEWAVGEGVVTGPASYHAAETRRFRLKYLAPEEAADLLPNFLLSYVHADPEGNALVASGPAATLDKIAADLAKVDVAPPQIEVEAVAVEVASVRDLEVALGYGAAARRTQVAVDSTAGELSFRSLSVSLAEVSARLTALRRRQTMRLRAQPRATVLNGRTATLFVGRQRYIQVSRSEWRGAVPELRSVPVGVSLEVTPWTGGREITLKVSPSVTTVDEVDSTSKLPVLGVRKATANVRLRDGESVLVGGLRLSQEDRRTWKIPILGDLPLIGGLFRSSRREETTRELAIFIGARVV